MKKATIIRIWVDFEHEGKVHNWYWDKRFENYSDKPNFSDSDVLEYVRKYLKLDISKMIDEIDNFGNPKYDFEGFEEFIEHKYKLKLVPEKMTNGDVTRVLLALYGIKTKKLNPKKAPWKLQDKHNTTDKEIDLAHFDFPKEWLDFLSDSSNLFQSISGGQEGPTMIELRSATNLKILDVKFWAKDEHIKITKSFFEKDPNKNNEEKMYRCQVIDLIRENDLYLSEGLLIWIPVLKIFGTYDQEHQNLIVFPDAKTKDICKNIGKYIAAQWLYGDSYLVKCGNIYDYYEPWKHFIFE